MLNITHVNVRRSGLPSNKLKAYCSITIDGCFMVRGIKLIEGTNGMFLAMPSRNPGADCPRCRHKNPSRMAYCGKCGNPIAKVNSRVLESENSDRADIAHPLNAECRQQILDKILVAFGELPQINSNAGCT